MELLTAYKGKAHLTSMQFRALIESICGSESRIANLDEKMILELAENNTVKIRSGILIHHGAVMQVKRGTYDQITYQNGSQGMKRIDLIVAKYSKSADTKIEDAEWELIQGEASDNDPVTPTFAETDMQDGDLEDRCAFAELHFDGINVTEVKQLVQVARNMEEMETELDELNRNLRVYTFSKSATVSYSGNNTMSVKCYRQGNVVTTYISYTGTLPKGIIGLSPSGVSGITIPEGFRPNNEAYGSYVGVAGTSVYEADNGRYRISTDGTIYHGCTDESYHERNVTITYHTDDPIPD